MSTISNSVVFIINKIREVCGEAPGKKRLQKFVFLIEEKGIELGFEYGMHFYGPYSEALDSTTALLSAEGVINFDYSSTTHFINVSKDIKDITTNGLSHGQIDTINDLIHHFKGYSASDLELLTTAIYAFNHLKDKSKSSVIAGVQKLKGSKYSVKQIEESLKHFPYFNKYIPG